MTIKGLVENFLETTPKFRERKHKDAGIVHLLLLRNDGLMPSTKTALAGFVKDYASADRAWRQALEHNPRLRGSDYADKIQLESKKRKELGYEN